MSTQEPEAFVQVGATRDGLDPYLDCVRRRGMLAVLVETPAYLRWRRALGRRPFDVEIEVDRPHSPTAVQDVLAGATIVPSVVLAGFERYVACAFELAVILRAAPWPSTGEPFRAYDKTEQRALLGRHAPGVAQPRYGPLAESAESLTYPQVVKPIDGGGGLGVYLVGEESGRSAAVARLGELCNYGGGQFAGIVVEEYLKGPEVSLQGIVRDGEAILLSVCEKLIALEDVPDVQGLHSFREVGHIARHGEFAEPELADLAREAVRAMGYRQGPFHVDIIRSGAAPVFVEMGFRLSGGGLVALVQLATGTDWAELAFAAAMAEPLPSLAQPRDSGRVAGQAALVSSAEVSAAYAAQSGPATVTVHPTASPPAVESISAADLELLASDRLRHTSTVALVRAVGDDADSIRAILQSIVSKRVKV